MGSGLLITMPSAPCVAVLADQRDGLREVRVGHARHGDQELVGQEVVGHGRSILPAGARSQAPRACGARSGRSTRARSPRPARHELPFVGEPQHRIALAHRRREGSNGAASRRMLIAASSISRCPLVRRMTTCSGCRRRGARPRAPDCRDSDRLRAASGKLQRADALDAPLPGVDVGRDLRPSRVCEQAVVGRRVAAQVQGFRGGARVDAHLRAAGATRPAAAVRRLRLELVAGHGARRPAASRREHVRSAAARTPRPVGGRLRALRLAASARAGWPRLPAARCAAGRARCPRRAGRARQVGRGFVVLARPGPPARAAPRASAAVAGRAGPREAHAEDHEAVQQRRDEQRGGEAILRPAAGDAARPCVQPPAAARSRP